MINSGLVWSCYALFLHNEQVTVSSQSYNPANTGHCPCAGSMLGQRRPRYTRVAYCHITPFYSLITLIPCHVIKAH